MMSQPYSSELYTDPRVKGLIGSTKLYRFGSTDTYEFLPEGRFELLFQIKGEFFHKTHSDQTWKKRPQCFVGGLHSKAYQVRSDRSDALCLGVTLRPELVHPLIKMDLSSFKDQVVQLNDLFGKDGEHVTDQLQHESAVDKQTEIILNFIQQKLRGSIQHRHGSALAHVIDSCRSMRIKDIARSLNMSDPHFRRVFREQIGLSPKNYFKVLRVHAAAHSIVSSKRKESLTQLAYQLGYFDQAHFIKEFKSVTGKSPSSFRAQLLG